MVDVLTVTHSQAKHAAIDYLRASSHGVDGKAEWHHVARLVKLADPDYYVNDARVVTLQAYAQQHGIAMTVNVIALAVVDLGDATRAVSEE